VRVGFTTRGRNLHQGKTCFTELTITAFAPPSLLEERMKHRCSVAGGASETRRRFELHEQNGGTLLVYEGNRPVPITQFLLWKVFPAAQDLVPLRARMEQFGQRAEQRFRSLKRESPNPTQ
jgi:hypothetical protein